MKAGLIEAAWEAYRRYVLHDAPSHDVAIIRIAFYAGARAATFAAKLGTDEIVDAMAREVSAFQLEVEKLARGEER